MAVTITAPQSKVVARGAVTLTWVAGYPQSSYEILYREKGQNAWSTFGKVVSTATSVTLDLSQFTDFIEYHYRVVTYADNVTSGSSMYSGSDTSLAYSILVVPASRVASMKIRYGTGMEEVPLYNTTNIPQRISSANNRFGGLVDPLAANASKVQVRVNGTTKAVAKDTASFSNTETYSYAYMTARYNYSYLAATTYYSYRYTTTYSYSTMYSYWRYYSYRVDLYGYYWYYYTYRSSYQNHMGYYSTYYAYERVNSGYSYTGYALDNYQVNGYNTNVNYAYAYTYMSYVTYSYRYAYNAFYK